ncbi:Deoxyribose-phosphate aldolase 2 [Planctomycetes bacterium CA13]|uniref:Deoxyribose-phosphate aldolase n=1 Tax=Novipirellula herctigrandis TaxID=2527986 RepID=A0A5C5YZ35_9BACT|nr:Deoxyribose-phosphate aldolase 2 [Planctomycetes bacterium CA13]
MTTWTKEKVAATIDHAALKANVTDQEIIENCELGKKYHVASVCVRPSDMPLVAKELAGSDVLPSMVVGFPHGDSKPEVKALEAKLGIEDGAKELDMVMNVGKFLSGDEDWVRRDIEAVVAEAKKAGGVEVKVILESCYLTPEQIARACEISREAGADYVKTSTGFGDGPATPEAIDVMIKTVGDTMGVKASGGIRDYETAKGYLEQGCKRLGSGGGTKTLLDQAPEA